MRPLSDAIHRDGPQVMLPANRTPTQTVKRHSMLAPKRSSQTLRAQAHESNPLTHPPRPPPGTPVVPARWYDADVRSSHPSTDGKPN